MPKDHRSSPRAVARLSARSASNPKSERCAWCALRSQVRSLLVLGALYLAKSDPSALSVTPTLSSSTIDPKDTATNFLLNLVSNCPMYPLNFRVKRQWKIRSIDDTMPSFIRCP
ncbi:hypothetical protein PGT21_020279 [Puccinia graminis f. sp. tritici]|uniref:Uncharacterized protein n=1 Tax=Puccinia graminis f. sp. tritici TaxID=56615 RepID=A0A5B0NUW2_PUCGR|nr:hypothetical protein PGT21_020279 [Puccinia graminis f. sp. tritici]